MRESKALPLIVVLVMLLLAAGFYISGGYSKLFEVSASDVVGNHLALDLSTLQSTIRAVSSPTIEERHFVQAVDTLGAKEDIPKLRNPFQRVFVAPPPSLQPKKEEAPKKKTTKAPVKRKKRIVRPDVTINGIIWDRSRPFAILNNDIYGEGDVISGYTIQTIQDTMIVLANNEDIFSIVIERE